MFLTVAVGRLVTAQMIPDGCITNMGVRRCRLSCETQSVHTWDSSEAPHSCPTASVTLPSAPCLPVLQGTAGPILAASGLLKDPLSQWAPTSNLSTRSSSWGDGPCGGPPLPTSATSQMEDPACGKEETVTYRNIWFPNSS